MENINEVMELSTEELDSVAGGATRVAFAQTHELQDLQVSTLTATRNGITSTNLQSTDAFSAKIAEFNKTGY